MACRRGGPGDDKCPGEAWQQLTLQGPWVPSRRSSACAASAYYDTAVTRRLDAQTDVVTAARQKTSIWGTGGQGGESQSGQADSGLPARVGAGSSLAQVEKGRGVSAIGCRSVLRSALCQVNQSVSAF